MKSIGLWQVDGSMPNLALMKISADLKLTGKLTHLQKMPDGNTQFGSVIFSENRPRVKFWLLAHPGIMMGGSGWDLTRDLPEHVERLEPDYSLYGIDYGLGFLSRGCVRHCPFCIVPQKEGPLRQVAEVGDLLNPRSSRLILLDNNILALANTLDILAELIDRELWVNFTQGLDIRLVTAEIATALANVHYMGRSWRHRYLHFAFDDTALERKIRHGIGLLLDAGIPSEHLCFYVLAGFGDQTAQDVLYRCNVLREYAVRPYIMRYRKNRQLNRLARWANAPKGFWRNPFSEYRRP